MTPLAFQNQSFSIGAVPDSTLVGVVLVDRPGLLFGAVRNKGTVAFTFSVQQSLDNGVSDAYAVINLRIKAANVASVTVQPGGVVDFVVETMTKTYTSFYATPSSGIAGDLLVFGRFNQFDQRFAVAMP